MRDPRMIYYGPHGCEACGKQIVRAAREHGGAEYDAPTGPIYPNTEWRLHTCDRSKALAQATYDTDPSPPSTFDVGSILDTLTSLSDTSGTDYSTPDTSTSSDFDFGGGGGFDGGGAGRDF